MNYQQAIEYIENLVLMGQKCPESPSLRRIEAFLSCYNSPHNTFKSFHIGGTNGKGSTAAMLDSILRQSNLKVGRFTGPHLLRFNERFHISGEPIADDEFAKCVSSLKIQSEKFSTLYSQFGQLSWFEFLTALMFFYFAENAIDIAVIEVGLGGRFDGTNVLSKLYATGITNVALDHERILGSSLESIALEKAGIIKTDVPIITGAHEPALGIISNRARQLGAEIIVCNGQNETGKIVDSKMVSNLDKIKNDIYRRGIYQYQNARLALNMVSQSGLLDFDTANGAEKSTSEDNINNHKLTIEGALSGLQNFYWPGRFQIIESKQLILDGAHNPAGINALRESLDYLFANQQFHFIFACYHDKDGLAMLANLLKTGDRLYLVDLLGKRSLFSPTTLVEYAQKLGVRASIYPAVTAALTEATSNCNDNQFIVVTGSFSIIKAIVQALGWQTVEDGLP